jgi:hypothetical protein
VLAILLSEIRPIPDIRPKTIAIRKEIIVDRNVILNPGIMKLSAFVYSGSVNIVNNIQMIVKARMIIHQFSALSKFFIFIIHHNKAIGTDFRAYYKFKFF